MVAVLLLFLFPGRNFENPYHLARPDHLSIAYLNMLLRAHPEDAEARLLLAQQQMALGELEEAHETLSLPAAGATTRSAARAEVVDAEAGPHPAGGHGARRSGAPQLLRGPRRRPPPDAPHPAARRSGRPGRLRAGDGRSGEAARAYLRLADLDRDNAIAWLEKAARWTEASGSPGRRRACTPRRRWPSARTRRR